MDSLAETIGSWLPIAEHVLSIIVHVLEVLQHLKGNR